MLLYLGTLRLDGLLRFGMPLDQGTLVVLGRLLHLDMLLWFREAASFWGVFCIWAP